MTILCSDVVGCGRISSDYRRNLVESSLYWRKQFREFPLTSRTQNFVAGAVFGDVAW